MLETTTVGSLPKPEYLAETEKLWPAWRLSGKELAQAKERAAVEWLRHQEEAGINILTAGEQQRIHFVHGFLENIRGSEENLRWKDTLGSEWRQYEEIFPALNDSRLDQVSLECADSRVPLSLMDLIKRQGLDGRRGGRHPGAGGIAGGGGRHHPGRNDPG